MARAPEMRQGLRAAPRDQPVLRIDGGVIDLPALARRLDDSAVLASDGDAYVLRRPLLVGPDATLIVERATLRLSTPHFAALVAAGRLFVIDATVTSFDPTTGAPSPLAADEAFRPFILGTGGSRLHFAGSRLASLGYFGEKAYGLAVSSGPAQSGTLPPPRLWMVDTRVEDLFYGLYTFEAADIVVLGSRFADNVMYGIDPHDFTVGLVIANNVVERTRRRHGIVLARGVRNAWVLDNLVRDNGGTGFMLDDRGSDVLVAGNQLVRNDWDGLTLFESTHTVIRRNRIVGNGRDGIRVRNSTGVVILDNAVGGNGSDGIEIYGSAGASEGPAALHGAQALVCVNAIGSPGDVPLDVHGTARVDWLRGAGADAVPLALLKVPDRKTVAPLLEAPPPAVTIVTMAGRATSVEPVEPTALDRLCRAAAGPGTAGSRLPPLP